MMGGFGFNLYGSRYGPVVGCCEHANEFMQSVKIL
jgi:hypothetical protein